MAKLIEKFASTMSASQRNNVATLLQEGATSGRFENENAFRDQLTRLSNIVQLINEPLYRFYQVGAFELVDNSRINNEFRLMRMDMETIYTELEAIQETVNAHSLFVDQRISDIRNSLASLDTQISTLELLSDEVDFNLAWVNTFNIIGSNSLSHSSVDASFLYRDIRKDLDFGLDNDMHLDIHKQGIILPIDEDKIIPIVGIEIIEGSSTTESDLNIDPSNNNLFNITAEGDGKFWVHGTLLLDKDAFLNPLQPPINGVVASVRLLFGGFQTFNTLALVPWTDTSLIIDQIQYKDVDGSFYNLLSSPITMLEKYTLLFDSITASEIIINLRQKSYVSLVDFIYSTTPEDLSAVMDVVDQSTLYNISFGSDTGTQHAKGYLYTIGFDLIEVGRSQFLETGIYVSNEYLSTKPVIEVGLKNSITHTQTTEGLVNDSIEFDLIKYNYGSDDALLFVETVPLVTSSASITHEALVLDEAGIGKLRMFPTYSSVKVYRDGTLLSIGTDYEVSVDKGITYVSAIVTTPVGPPIEYWVKIIDALNTSNYTVSYTIASSHPTLSTEVYLNEDSTAYIAPDSIKFLQPSSLPQIAYCKMFVRIVARSFDLLSTRSSPIVTEYSLLARESSFSAI